MLTATAAPNHTDLCAARRQPHLNVTLQLSVTLKESSCKEFHELAAGNACSYALASVATDAHKRAIFRGRTRKKTSYKIKNYRLFSSRDWGPQHWTKLRCLAKITEKSQDFRGASRNLGPVLDIIQPIIIMLRTTCTHLNHIKTSRLFRFRWQFCFRTQSPIQHWEPFREFVFRTKAELNRLAMVPVRKCKAVSTATKFFFRSPWLCIEMFPSWRLLQESKQMWRHRAKRLDPS